MSGKGGGKLKLFVGNLPASTAEDDLRQLFNEFGDVREVHVMPAARSRLGYACAFVVFGSGSNVDEAILALNGKHRFSPDCDAITVSYARADEANKKKQQQQQQHDQWGGDQMWQYQQYYAAQMAMMQAYGMAGYNPYAAYGGDALASLAGLTGAYPGGWEAPEAPGGGGGGGGGGKGARDTEDAKLFLGGLPNGVTEQEVKMVFSQVGTVKEVHIMHGKSQSGQACAFVVFPDHYSAQLAIRTLNKTPWHSAPDAPPIIVRAADKVQKKKGGGGPGGPGGPGGGMRMDLAA